MRLQITINEPSINGYFYVSPNNGQLLSNLDNIVSDNECIEILAPKILNSIPLNQLEQTITHWVKKLRHGGRIIVGGNDLYEICKKVVRAEIDSGVANFLIFGSQVGIWDVHRGQISLQDLVDLFEKLGLKIMKKKLSGVEMVVEAIRQ